MAQLDRFTAARYDPRAWARLFARAGARYAVLTSRHHDGVALWDTAEGELNVVRHTPRAATWSPRTWTPCARRG